MWIQAIVVSELGFFPRSYKNPLVGINNRPDKAKRVNSVFCSQSMELDKTHLLKFREFQKSFFIHFVSYFRSFL
jgi:hypothetical protein